MKNPCAEIVLGGPTICSIKNSKYYEVLKRMHYKMQTEKCMTQREKCMTQRVLQGYEIAIVGIPFHYMNDVIRFLIANDLAHFNDQQWQKHHGVMYPDVVERCLKDEIGGCGSMCVHLLVDMEGEIGWNFDNKLGWEYLYDNILDKNAIYSFNSLVGRDL